MRTITLSEEDKGFLSLVAEAAFVNPFSQRRIDLDLKILGGRRGQKWADFVADVLERVHGRIQGLDQSCSRQVSLQDFAPADQPVMSGAFLFYIFHRYHEALDGIILQQIHPPHDAIKVPFANEVLGELESRGYHRKQAIRYFSLFYQIRRAFHFIDRGLLGCCASMQSLREQLWNTIFTHDIRWYDELLWDQMEDFSILLLGPTGAGKGAAAAAIGRSGYIPFDERKQTFAQCFMQTFVSVNLSQYAETLLESELFGHNKGAFTGAVSSHEGLLSLCGPHGSVFLDEIGDISPTVQIKLLKVLEERQFNPVGSHEVCRFQGRVIAATHQPIGALREQGRFRDDFYYRLCSDCIHVPSLQQRVQEDPQELDLLISHVVSRILGQENEELCQTVRKVIDEQLGGGYAWPGNVRELAQCIRRIIIRRSYEGENQVVVSCSGPTDQLAEAMRTGSLTAEQLMAHYCGLLYDRLGTYEEVSRRTDLDRRTVKRYLQLLKEKEA